MLIPKPINIETTMKSHLRFSYQTVLLGILGILLFSWTTATGQTATEAWVRRYSSTDADSYDYSHGIAVDSDGNAIVAGSTHEGFTGSDMLIIKYSGAGVALWTNRYGGPADRDDRARAVAVDKSGHVFVTGSSTDIQGNFAYTTIAYSSAGAPLWTNHYSGRPNGHDDANALAVDEQGNVFVTGYSLGTGGNWDYTTIAYSFAGVPLWTNRYNGPANDDDFVAGIAVDADGNVFVTGSSRSSEGSDYATVAYSAAGMPLWTNRYNAPGNGWDEASAVAVHGNGNVFVTGRSTDTRGNSDYATIAFSGAGVPLWTNYYSGPRSADYAHAIAVDNAANVFVTGSSIGSASWDYATVAYSSAGIALWTNRYDGPGNRDDSARVIAVDYSGHVLVTGVSTGIGNSLDYATIKYSPVGVALWTNRYDGPGNPTDQVSAMAVDNGANVFVTGYSYSSGGSSSDFVTIAYSGNGVALWTNRYNGPANSTDEASAVAVNNGGNIFVTGYSFGAEGSDYVTIAYSDAGVSLWTNRYNGAANGADRASSAAVDKNGNVFVTGYSSGSGSSSDYLTIAYLDAGVPLWTNRYNGPANGTDQANAVAADSSGNLFVTGLSIGSGGNSDYATIAYSSSGAALWTNRYNGPGNGTDQANALAVDSGGNVFVTGYSYGSGSSSDYLTIAYSGLGVALWTNRYDGPGNSTDSAAAVAVDNSGNVFVTGDSFGTARSSDYATIAYSATGMALWTNRYNGPGNTNDSASSVAVDANGNVFVTGHSIGAGTGSDYTTITYSATGTALWTNRYNGPVNGPDHATAIAADNSGNVVVTGFSTGSGGNSDYATIAYSGAGVPLWTNRYNGSADGNDMPQTRSSLAISPHGAAYVTGTSDGFRAAGIGPIYDFATVKYVWRPYLAIQPLTAGSSTVNLTLSGPTNSSWSIERALRTTGPWTNLGPSLIATNGLGLFQDSNPPARGAFYRATQP